MPHAVRPLPAWLIFDVRRGGRIVTVFSIAAILGLGIPELIVIVVIVLCILFLRRSDR